jgi:hypothetical protein
MSIVLVIPTLNLSILSLLVSFFPIITILIISYSFIFCYLVVLLYYPYCSDTLNLFTFGIIQIRHSSFLYSSECSHVIVILSLLFTGCLFIQYLPVYESFSHNWLNGDDQFCSMSFCFFMVTS